MSIGLRLDLRQSQQLVMTPQLQQAIKLLQMSNIELSDFVERELEKNPLLKVETGEATADTAEERGPAAPEQEANTDAGPIAADRVTGDDTVSVEGFSPEPEQSFADTTPTASGMNDGLSLGSYRVSGSGGAEGLPSLEERVAERPGLRDHLRAQLGEMRCAPTVGLIARYLVEELDEHGYLRGGLPEIANRLDVGEADAQAALELLQSCDPTGVGARDIGECLRLQLAERGMLDQRMSVMTENLDLLATGGLKKLRALCDVTDSALGAMVQTLRGLDPRPCASFDGVEPETLIPDILLKRTNWGGWHLELNPDTLPRVLIERTYAAEIDSSRCAEARRFLSDCHANASWLIKSLDQRAKTIIKIASEIVRRQERFFREGIAGLAPLTLREVAEAVDMHESTASRVTSNKYIATERGIFELKLFFTNAVGTGEGMVAAEAIRHRIKAMVDAESADAILSDDAIVDALLAENIEVARRTVAKYRKSLDIPSSVDRRRQKAMGQLGN